MLATEKVETVLTARRLYLETGIPFLSLVICCPMFFFFLWFFVVVLRPSLSYCCCYSLCFSVQHAVSIVAFFFLALIQSSPVHFPASSYSFLVLFLFFNSLKHSLMFTIQLSCSQPVFPPLPGFFRSMSSFVLRGKTKNLTPVYICTSV